MRCRSHDRDLDEVAVLGIVPDLSPVKADIPHGHESISRAGAPDPLRPRARASDGHPSCANRIAQRVADAAKKHKVSDATIYAWREPSGQMEAGGVERLKALNLGMSG